MKTASAPAIERSSCNLYECCNAQSQEIVAGPPSSTPPVPALHSIIHAPLTVWYNTKCPVCNAGISRQQRKLRAAAVSSAIVFRDINLEPEALRHHGVGVDD